MKQFLEWDKEWLLYLNSHHTPWLDQVMFWITKTEVWFPLYLLLLYLIIRVYKSKTWIILIGIAITILLADQVTSHLMKPFFSRLRPSHEPELSGLIHTVNGYVGGLYGFASSHAANTFGTAFYCWFILRTEYKWVWVVFIWAALVTYSRIYLGVHYPGDVLAGAVIGVGSAGLGVWLTKSLERYSLNVIR